MAWETSFQAPTRIDVWVGFHQGLADFTQQLKKTPTWPLVLTISLSFRFVLESCEVLHYNPQFRLPM